MPKGISIVAGNKAGDELATKGPPDIRAPCIVRAQRVRSGESAMAKGSEFRAGLLCLRPRTKRRQKEGRDRYRENEGQGDNSFPSHS